MIVKVSSVFILRFENPEFFSAFKLEARSSWPAAIFYLISTVWTTL